MDSEQPPIPRLEFRPVIPERWNDLDELLGEHGAGDGCYCMWWRTTRAEFERNRGEGNRSAMKAIVDSGHVPGLLAYSDGKPIAWCSLAPRETYPSLNRSPRFRRVDREPVWSIACFWVLPSFRGKGLMVPFLNAAIEYAKGQGAKIVEAYPVEPELLATGGSGYMGVTPAFQEVGFVEVHRRSAHQPIMRYFIA